MSELSVVVSRRFAASTARVFEAWLDPVVLAKFMRPGPDMSAPKVTTDPVVGGAFEIVMMAGDQEIPHRGIYKEINRHTRLAFTWESPFSEPDSLVTLDFVDIDGETDLTLTHVRFPSEDSRANHEGGWTAILACLDPALSDVAAA